MEIEQCEATHWKGETDSEKCLGAASLSAFAEIPLHPVALDRDRLPLEL